MRKLANRILVFLLLSVPMASFAQSSVSGKVLNDKDGSPLEGVSIVVKGKNTGTKTDGNGSFSINAAKGDVIVVTYVNFKPQTIKVKDASSITIRLERADATMDEVVVTAMDIKRNPRELSYSTGRVTGAEVQETQRENFLNALGGRVAGVSITPTGGQAGASTNIVLRGYNSLALSNQPLFVIDGVIVDNQVIDENSNSGSGLGLSEAGRTNGVTSNRFTDYTNRVSDLNPNDIESITVLKGPEATALYGSQASSGAIIITTKKAKNVTAKKFKVLGVNYDNSFRVQKLTRTPDINTDYDMGSNGRLDSTFIYYGPKLPAGTQKVDNIKNFFKDGFAQTHNLAVNFGNKDISFRVSGSYFDQSGVVPENNYKRYTLNATTTLHYKKLVEVIPAFTYTHSENDKPLRGAGGYLLNILRWPATDNVLNAFNPDGTKREIYIAGDANEEIDNPYWNVQSNRSYDVLNKKSASLSVNITPYSWLAIAGRFGYETYENDGWSFYHPESFIYSKARRGEQDNFYRKYRGYNHTITATAKHSIGNFNGRLMLGTMWQDYKTSMWAVNGTGLADPVTFQFDKKMVGDSNITNPASRTRLYRNNFFNDYNYRMQRQFAYFGEFAVNWKNIIFLNYTHRFEEGSTLPKVNRKVNYPAGGVSVIFTDLIKPLKNSNFLSYGKIRASLANTAKSNTPYSNQSIFVSQTSSGQGFLYDFTNNNFNLLPERQSTYEIGTELRFFKSRFSIDATYYNTLNKDQILEILRASYGTGYVLNTLNLSSTRNQGVEISTNFKMVQKKNFNWSLGLNFNRTWNKLLTLPDVLPEFYIADTWLYANARAGLRRGGPTTGITSWGYQRNNAGQILVDPTTGLPLIDQNFLVRGDRNPDFTLGINNTFRLKNWSLSMLWDAKVGGDVFNGNQMFLTSIGRSTLTADREKAQVFNGVLKDGLENSANPTPNNISIVPYYNQGYYTIGLSEEYFIEKDVNYLRLRDVTLSYNFKPMLKKAKYIKNMSAFVTGNNLVLITNYTGADPSVNGNTPGTKGVGAFGFDYGTLPETVSINFGIRAGF